ncbi:hypothetical protein HRW14_17230 [Streptomyces lunaelactis]|nr:hypothetical protein [Streptomyces lunaelactis]NUK65077.1 hypothetical protein [Streptomyces lunaelactis]
MHESAVILNELAQGLRSMGEGVAWFESLDVEGQSSALRLLAQFCVQARAVSEDGPESIRRAGIRPRHTPAVLLGRGSINAQLWKIAGLAPQHERLKAFRLLIAVLAVADGRRRDRYCGDECSHSWHRLDDTRDSGHASPDSERVGGS